jgi:lipooligosaccharide transport system permease protein
MTAYLLTLAQDLPSLRRSRRMVQRNLVVYKHGWMVIFSGFFEPVFYLFSLGVGLGGMVPPIDGITYGAYVAPGLLAASCMNGAITDGFFNIHFKLHIQKTYDGILATPMRVPDVAFGEMLWALSRGSMYAGAFLLVLVIVGGLSGTRLLLSPWGVLAFPAAVLAAASYSAIAICTTTFVRKFQDFDLVMGLAIMPMFLFSGTFFPIATVPVPARWIIEALPLYHGVAMLRPLMTGQVTPSILLHVIYLIGVGTAAFVIAMRRLERALIK